MTSSADLGGMAGFGAVAPEADEPLFHAAWEPRVLGMIVALGACGLWNLDQSRAARESLPPGQYVQMPYYLIWLEAAQKLMLERGAVHSDELADGVMRHPPIAVKRCLKAEDVAGALAAGGPTDRESAEPTGFAVGDAVQTINEWPETHTRLPRYARDKVGVITQVYAPHVYPDSNATGAGEDPQWLYKVRFDAATLWGSRARDGDSVTLDLWEPYLRHV